MFNNILYTNDLTNNVNQIEQPKHDIFDRYFTNPKLVKYSFITWIILILVINLLLYRFIIFKDKLDNEIEYTVLRFNRETIKLERSTEKVVIDKFLNKKLVFFIIVFIIGRLIFLWLMCDVFNTKFAIFLKWCILIVGTIFFILSVKNIIQYDGLPNEDINKATKGYDYITSIITNISFFIILYYLKLDDDYIITHEKQNDLNKYKTNNKKNVTKKYEDDDFNDNNDIM